jgi:hypothetical protein
MKTINLIKEYTQESIWRAALGNSAPLLTHADETDCLDAPDWIPAGSSKPMHKFTPAFRVVSSIVTRYSEYDPA